MKSLLKKVLPPLKPLPQRKKKLFKTPYNLGNVATYQEMKMRLRSMGYIMVSALALSTSLFAGTLSGGGGSEYAAMFRERALVIFAKMKEEGIDEQLVDELQESLKQTEIIVVDTLKKNPFQKIKNEKYLVAYGWPGLIQLKASYWAKDASNEIWERSDHHILHEITRSSKNYQDIDASYELSIGQLNLNEASKFNEPELCIKLTHYYTNYRADYEIEIQIFDSKAQKFKKIWSQGVELDYGNDRSRMQFLDNTSEQMMKAFIQTGRCLPEENNQI